MKRSYHDPNYQSPVSSSPMVRLMHQCWSAECYASWEAMVETWLQDQPEGYELTLTPASIAVPLVPPACR